MCQSVLRKHNHSSSSTPHLAMRDGLHITVTDEKNNLVMRIEISGTQANIVEASDNYRDDLDELLAIYNQFYMDD